MSSKPQIQIIHSLLARLGMDDDTYRDVLSRYRNRNGLPARSSKDLTDVQAQQLISRLKYQLVGQNQRAFEHLANRGNDMATPKQLRKIDAMWAQYMRRLMERGKNKIEPTRDNRTKSLNHWLNRRFHRASIEMVERQLVQQIVKALRTMVDTAGEEDCRED
jgi:predicted transcriptional regulator